MVVNTEVEVISLEAALQYTDCSWQSKLAISTTVEHQVILIVWHVHTSHIMVDCFFWILFTVLDRLDDGTLSIDLCRLDLEREGSKSFITNLTKYEAQPSLISKIISSKLDMRKLQGKVIVNALDLFKLGINWRFLSFPDVMSSFKYLSNQLDSGIIIVVTRNKYVPVCWRWLFSSFVWGQNWKNTTQVKALMFSKTRSN